MYDVNSVIKSLCGAQGKGPTMDLVFYVSAIKIDADGFSASQGHYIFDIMYICKLIKIPTTSYVNATLKRWRHDFTRNREGKYSNP